VWSNAANQRRAPEGKIILKALEALPNPRTDDSTENGGDNVQSFYFRNHMSVMFLTFNNAAFIGSFTFNFVLKLFLT